MRHKDDGHLVIISHITINKLVLEPSSLLRYECWLLVPWRILMI